LLLPAIFFLGDYLFIQNCYFQADFPKLPHLISGNTGSLHKKVSYTRNLGKNLRNNHPWDDIHNQRNLIKLAGAGANDLPSAWASPGAIPYAMRERKTLQRTF
jgi:hypothetical protein